MVLVKWYSCVCYNINYASVLQAYQDLTAFLTAMSVAVKGKTLQHKCHVSEMTGRLLKLLEILDTWIDEVPPVDQPQRFGNKAFRDWFQKLKEVGNRCTFQIRNWQHLYKMAKLQIRIRTVCYCSFYCTICSGISLLKLSSRLVQVVLKLKLDIGAVEEGRVKPQIQLLPLSVVEGNKL